MVKLETSWRVDFALAWMVHPLSVLIVLLPRLLVLSAFDFCLTQWLYENLLYSMEFHEFIAYIVMLRGFNLTSPLNRSWTLFFYYVKNIFYLDSTNFILLIVSILLHLYGTFFLCLIVCICHGNNTYSKLTFQIGFLPY